jgi:spore photoproduct lyase
MKSYLNFSPLTVYADPVESIREIRRIAKANPGTLVRVGSGEVGDSLLLDPLFGLGPDFIKGLSDLRNVAFESKTKTDFVDHLLGIENKGSAVIGFSLNPQSMIESEEPFAATLEERIAAAHKAVNSGYKVAFHFDPVYREAAEAGEYNDLIRTHLLKFRSESLAWISFGTIRFTPALKEKMGNRAYLSDEFVVAPDGKYRYVQKKRIEIYRNILREFRDRPEAPVYFCMENEAVWEAVFGAVPEQTAHASFLFTPIEGVEPHSRERPSGGNRQEQR